MRTVLATLLLGLALFAAGCCKCNDAMPQPPPPPPPATPPPPPPPPPAN